VQSTPRRPLAPLHRGKLNEECVRQTLTVAAAALLATGCVSTSDFNQHVTSADAAIKAAQQDAAAAKARCRAAQSAANSASSTATGRPEHANQALQAAQGAQACCDATNEKIDRAFKKSLGK